MITIKTQSRTLGKYINETTALKRLRVFGLTSFEAESKILELSENGSDTIILVENGDKKLSLKDMQDRVEKLTRGE